MITLPEEKCQPFTFNWAHLVQKNSRPGSKVITKFDRALTKNFFNLLFK